MLFVSAGALTNLLGETPTRGKPLKANAQKEHREAGRGFIHL